MNRRVLITGATGFIGSHLTELLVRSGDEVTCLRRKTSNLRWLKDLNVQYHTGEVTDKKSLRDAVRDKEIIFHLASLTKATDPRDYYRVNAQGARNLLEVCTRENPNIRRFILVSSQAATGPSPSETPIDETWPPEPVTDYGKSKLEAEKIAREFMESIPITIVRPPAVYGPRDRYIYIQFKLISKIKKRGLIFSIGKQDQLVSLVYAPDLAKAVNILSECHKASGETYFVANPEPYRWSRLCQEIAATLEKEIKRYIRLPLWLAELAAFCCEVKASLTKKATILNRQKIRELSQVYWVCSPGKLERDTGFVCPTTVSQGIQETAHWYRENGWL